MNVWIVGVSDREANSIEAVCSTKEIAERELFKVRDRLVGQWKKYDKKCQEDAARYEGQKNVTLPKNIYIKMIENLSSNDYENWNNYPQRKPYLYNVNIIEE